jgi:DNA polymerase-3 subunit alpha
LTLHNIKTGQDIKTKITQGKIYKENPFGLFSVLKVDGFTKRFKKKKISNEWQNSEEVEDVLEEFEVIK